MLFMTKGRSYFLFLACLLAVECPVAQERVWTSADGDLRVRQVFSSASGEHWGATVEREDGVALVIDGRRLEGKDDFGSLRLEDDGAFSFWFKEESNEYVATPAGNIGPAEHMRMPDLAVLRQAGVVSPGSWAHRGGTRSVFGARTLDGDWTCLMRYPAAPGFQEETTLPDSRLAPAGSDPTSTLASPVRYELVGAQPVFIAKDGRGECLWGGGYERTCGDRIALLSLSPGGERLAFAVQQGGLLELVTGKGRFGPTRYLDWITWSPDGKQMAFVMEADARHVLMLDGNELARFPRIQSLAWTAQGLSFLAHQAGSSIAVSGQRVLLEERVLHGLYAAPDGRVVVWGNDPEGGGVLWPFEHLPGLQQIWGAGFLAGSEFFAAARFAGGKSGFLFNGDGLGGLAVVTAVMVSPDGSHLAVLGAGGAGPLLFLNGRIKESQQGRITDVEWCPEGQPRLRSSGKTGECVERGPHVTCCPRIVFTACLEDGQAAALCMTPEGYSWMQGANALTAPYQDVPLTLVYRQTETGSTWFAARRGDRWYRVQAADETGLPGRPAMVHAGDDGPWYLVHSDGKRQWVAPKFAAPLAGNVHPPFFHDGHSVFWATAEGREVWVVDGKTSESFVRIPAAPAFHRGGFYFVALDGERLQVLKHMFAPDHEGESP